MRCKHCNNEVTSGQKLTTVRAFGRNGKLNKAYVHPTCITNRLPRNMFTAQLIKVGM